jgi:hypothetical protein
VAIIKTIAKCLTKAVLLFAMLILATVLYDVLFAGFVSLDRIRNDSFSLAGSYNRTQQAPFAGQRSRAKDWTTLLDPAKPLAGTRVVTVVVKNDQITTDYEFKLPKTHELFKSVQRGEVADADRFVDAVLGAITVDGKRVSFKRLSIAVADQTGIISLASKPIEVLPLKHTVAIMTPTSKGACCRDKSSVIILTDSMQLISAYGEPLPVEQSPDRTVFELQPNDCCIKFDLLPTEQARFSWLQRAKASFAAGSGGHLVRSLSSTVVRMSRLRLPPVASEVVFWLVISLPFILLSIWSKKARIGRDETTGRYAGATPLLLGFYGGMLVLDALYAGVRHFGRWWPSGPVLSWLQTHEMLLEVHLVNRLSEESSVSVAALILVAALVVWPSAVRRWQAHQHLIGSTVPIGELMQMVGLFFALLLLIANLADLPKGSFVRQTPSGPPLTDVYPFLCVGLSSLCLLGLFAIVSAGLKIGSWTWLAALNCTLLLIALALLNALLGTTTYEPDVKTASMVLASGSAIALLLSFLRISSGALAGRSLLTTWKCFSPPLRFLLPLALVAAAMPWGWHRAERTWDAWDAAIWVDWLIYLFLLVAVLAGLRRLAATNHDSVGIPFEAGYLGTLAALAILLNGRFLYIPVPLLLGYVLFQHWLFPKGQASRVAAVRSLAWSPRLVLDATRQSKKAARELKALHKEGMSKKLSVDELDYPSHKKKLVDLEASINLAPSAIALPETRISSSIGALQVPLSHPVGSVGMSVGPTNGSSWQNGKVAAAWSIVLSLPWIVLYFRREGLGRLTSQHFPVLAVIAEVGWQVARWMLIGFLLGYFYPYIRGSNGLRKGLALAFAILLPHLVLESLLVVAHRDSWKAFLPFFLGILSNCILVGFLAGDVRMLRQAHYSLSDVLDFSNFGTLLARFASISAAVAAALLAALTTSAGQYVFGKITDNAGKGLGP